MSLTTDPSDPGLSRTRPDGQQERYLVLSEEERASGFVRPVRTQYQHVGVRPKHPLRELTPEERERFGQYGYVKFEEYPAGGSSATGRLWTHAQLNSGCRAVTTMGRAIAETYARNPKFYGATYCVGCCKHFPVEEFVWDGTDQTVGS
jgi:hypothetical protein